MAVAESHHWSSSGKRRRSVAVRPKARHTLTVFTSAFLVAAVPAALRSPAQLLFAAPAYRQLPRRPTAWASAAPTGGAAPFCGPSSGVALLDRVSASQHSTLPMAAGAATLGWIDPRRWAGAPPSPSERLSPREWTRMYRMLGIPEDASKDQVLKATTRLRRKYSENEEALERVETANLWIMTRIVSRNEEARRQRQQANRMRELGDSPRRLFQKYILGYLPPSVRQMVEPPNTKHFRWTSGLLGLFALLGLCVPTQATNFVGLAAASAMGLVYQRNRPEPLKDDMGNVGEVKKVNPKEMIATILLVISGCLIGVGLSLLIGYVVDTPFQVIFASTTCVVLWVFSLFFKVYQCFDA